MTRDDDEAPIESSAANASAYVPSFDDFDHAVTSALDALDSLSVFGDAKRRFSNSTTFAGVHARATDGTDAREEEWEE